MRFSLPWERIQEIVRCGRVLCINARALHVKSAELRERSYLLRQKSADLKEFSAETILGILARHDARSES